MCKKLPDSYPVPSKHLKPHKCDGFPEVYYDAEYNVFRIPPLTYRGTAVRFCPHCGERLEASTDNIDVLKK